jgi:hypothetical protein
MDLETTGKPTGLPRLEGLVEAFQLVRIEVVHHQDDRLGVWIVLSQHPFDARGPIDRCPLNSTERSFLPKRS